MWEVVLSCKYTKAVRYRICCGFFSFFFIGRREMNVSSVIKLDLVSAWATSCLLFQWVKGAAPSRSHAACFDDLHPASALKF